MARRWLKNGVSKSMPPPAVNDGPQVYGSWSGPPIYDPPTRPWTKGVISPVGKRKMRPPWIVVIPLLLPDEFFNVSCELPSSCAPTYLLKYRAPLKIKPTSDDL